MCDTPKIIKICSKKDNILEEILSISSKLYEDQKLILSKLECLEKRIINIERKVELSSKDETAIEDLVELKKIDLNIDKSNVLKVLSYRDYRSVLLIFRQVYKNKNNLKYSYPIRANGKRSFDFYANNKWNNDSFGTISRNIICDNIQNLFIKYNDLDNGDVSDEDFMNNQQFICKLSDDKYRKEVFKSIAEEIRLNNI